MKRILLILIFLCGIQTVFGQAFKMPTASDYPNLRKICARSADFIPRGWTLMDKAEGDLNGDKKNDFVLVIKANKESFLNKSENLVNKQFDTNPRILAILFSENSRYKLVLQSNTFIAMSDSPSMLEPFQSVKIANGVLRFDFEIFYSAGGWTMYEMTYKFRFQNGAFALIGADKITTQRNSGEVETRSYNFLTDKLKTTNGDISGKNNKVQWTTYNLQHLKSFETFSEPFKWEIEKDYFL